MSHICQITKRKAMFGNNRSHAMNATKKKFLLNIHTHRFWVAEQKKFIKLKVSTKGMRYIDKKGINVVLNEMKLLSKKK
ncbi:50S ribosomal protein L28 [Buchnera aphidicola (Thelaxes californica)]|uniref:Large ribosomal subunit protein bL28 n=1 Tax=Buchnera aphidicola (Thelaxes californica) TaxID=1315998 RepID=A0A4D6Y9F3_9GAMM|nr:50S ribosomal protein L28 [Buchnera aphidicola]QCI26626.1 50S ribosomal protein L28 [Buchnera aphidicola (Thelaxes californica)]